MHLPIRHFFCELETDLGLANPPHSPEETTAPQSDISTINKDLPQFLKYIFPSSKNWTRVRFLRYRDLRLPFANIRRMYIDLTDKNVQLMLDYLYSRQEILTKVPPVISVFWAFVKKPEPECLL